uniref:Uncharacterized protein n=1 Tax=Anopheles quadriannulatus TaxID=34691 RepID=A0A182XSW8_ANOQN
MIGGVLVNPAFAYSVVLVKLNSSQVDFDLGVFSHQTLSAIKYQIIPHLLFTKVLAYIKTNT